MIDLGAIKARRVMRKLPFPCPRCERFDSEKARKMHRKAVHVSDLTKARRAAYQADRREIDEAIREFRLSR